MYNNQLLNSYEKQLPQLPKHSLWKYTRNICTILGIFVSVVGLFSIKKTALEYIYSFFIIISLILAITYIIRLELRKTHRYSEAILFITHSSHIMKDTIRRFQNGQISEDDYNITLNQLANNISNCYSIIKGKRCSVSIKRLEFDGEISTLARDSASQTRYNKDTNLKDTTHLLKDNTDFQTLVDDNGREGRFFRCNDLKDLWKSKKYINSSFKIVGEPFIKKRFLNKFDYVSNWNLDYQSTLICPIRYITTITEDKHYFGFLCIDCRSRNIFNSDLDVELAYCFANHIYSLDTQKNTISDLNSEIYKLRKDNSQLFEMLDCETSPV